MPQKVGTVGAHGPIKPFEFFTPPPGTLQPPCLGDDSDNWWGGVQQCFASVALAALVATTSLSGQLASSVTQERDDYVPPPTANIVDEDYWQNRTSPVAASNWIAPFDQVDPDYTAPIAFQPDEDYWQNPVAPVPASFWLALPLGGEPDSYTFQPDEDYWQNPVAPLPPMFGKLYIPDPDEIPAGTLYGQPDEDYWQNPTPPVPATLLRLPYLPDPEEIPAGSLLKFTSPDEDYWQNRVAPVPATFAVVAWTDGDFAPPTTFQPDEDYWRNPPPPVPATLAWPAPWSFDTQEPGTLSKFTSPDEDYWQNQVAPVAAILRVPSLWVDPDFPGIAPVFQPDEDYWIPTLGPMPTQWIAGGIFQYLPLDHEEIPAGSLLQTYSRDAQEIILGVTLPNNAFSRTGQDFTLAATLPNNALARDAGEVLFVVVAKTKYPVVFVVT
jgi:hypothetical protein